MTVAELHVAAAADDDDEDVRVVFAVARQSAVVAAVDQCFEAAALAVKTSAVEMFEIAVLVVHDVAAAAVAAGPRGLPAAFAKGRCFVGG